jgi:hypothetical protein
MSLPVFEIVLLLTVVVIWIGFALVRSARPSLSKDPSAPARACPDAKCRHRNPGEAEFCAKCGQRLGKETS